ncbi:MAG: fibronectin type III domain-containing protein [Phycisphaerales bacterium]|nr:fibronectin type III domain-containing protein [Phycisphaerales bacterium]
MHANKIIHQLPTGQPGTRQGGLLAAISMLPATARRAGLAAVVLALAMTAQAQTFSYWTSLPQSPTGVALSRPAAFDGSLTLSWRNRSSYADYYAVNRIYESQNDGAYRLIASVSTSTTSFTRTGIQRGVKYKYKLRIEPLRGTGSPTSAYSAIVSAKYGYLSPASNFTLVEISASSLKFTWNDEADAESGYRITWTDPWGNSDEEFAGPDAQSIVIPGLSPDVSYNVSIRSFDATGAQSSQRVFVNASTAPSDLRNLQATVLSVGNWGVVRLSWINDSFNDGTKVYVSKTENGVLQVFESYLYPNSAGPVGIDFTWLTRGVPHTFKVSYQVCIGGLAPTSGGLFETSCNFWEPKSWTVSATP